MTYDHWKTTDPADDQLGSRMLHRVKSISLQCAADDAAVIAETIEALSNLLDRFYKTHGEDLGKKLTVLIPGHEDAIEQTVATRVYAFAHSLEPVED